MLEVMDCLHEDYTNLIKKKWQAIEFLETHYVLKIRETVVYLRMRVRMRTQEDLASVGKVLGVRYKMEMSS